MPPVRDAATIMLVRDALDGSGIEVCMLQRNLAAEFVAGAYVFPGGAVDDADRQPEAARWCEGRTDRTASEALGLEVGGLAFWVAALRECFEEAGVLLARHRGEPGRPGPLLDTSDPAMATRFARHRDDLNEGRVGLAEVCEAEDLVLPVGDIHYVSHWITPEVAPKRYDTRFFVALSPSGQQAVHDDGETIATSWVRPADALDQAGAGRIELMPPTVANLSAIGRFPTADAVIDWARSVTDVPTILPIVRVEGGELIVLRPGDAGYDEAAAEAAAAARDGAPGPGLAAGGA
ncbi:MAG: hypothetical protein M0Z62_11710 [Actinomycetota bacterium]|nr:hypothetical protein [Actinomycetota bacterium]